MFFFDGKSALSPQSDWIWRRARLFFFFPAMTVPALCSADIKLSKKTQNLQISGTSDKLALEKITFLF